MQRTEYDMRISDGSSDGCSSDLPGGDPRRLRYASDGGPYRRRSENAGDADATGKPVRHRLRDQTWPTRRPRPGTRPLSRRRLLLGGAYYFAPLGAAAFCYRAAQVGSEAEARNPQTATPSGRA